MHHVRDNQRLASRRAVLCLHVVHLKSFNARLAVDYPVYSMVICQVIDKLKLVLLFAAQYLTEWVKMTVIFVSYGSLAQHSAASNHTQRLIVRKIAIITFI